MTVIILAAGYAKRLHPYTKNFPKSLLKIAGRPLLNYTLDKISEIKGTERIFIVTNNRFFPIFRKWRDGLSDYPALNIRIINDGTNTNADRLGSIGDLYFAIQSAGINDDCLVICSDKVFNFSLNDFIQFGREKNAVANTCERAPSSGELKNKHGCAILNEKDRITEFHEKPEIPPSNIKSLTFYYFPAETLHFVQEYLLTGASKDAPGYLSHWLCKKTPMFAWMINGECLDVGNPESYREVNNRFRRKGGFSG